MRSYEVSYAFEFNKSFEHLKLNCFVKKVIKETYLLLEIVKLINILYFKVFILSV
jgi:hypothetical protein